MMGNVYESVENLVGEKGENAGHQVFKGLFKQIIVGIVWYRVEATVLEPERRKDSHKVMCVEWLGYVNLDNLLMYIV